MAGPLDLGQMLDDGRELVIEPARRVDDERHDVGVAGAVPGRLRHGTVELALGLKDAGRIDEDDLGVTDKGEAAYRSAGGLCLVRDDGDFGADERVGQRRLAAIRRADQRDETAARLVVALSLSHWPAGARCPRA